MEKKTFLFRNLRKSKDFNNLDAVAVTETWLHDGYFDGEILSSSLYTIFRKDREAKPLRNVDHLTLDVPSSRTDVFKNSFFVRICRLWNELPLSIRESNTLSIFRKNLMALGTDH